VVVYMLFKSNTSHFCALADTSPLSFGLNSVSPGQLLRFSEVRASSSSGQVHISSPFLPDFSISIPLRVQRFERYLSRILGLSL
jgi:hypothetical protein